MIYHLALDVSGAQRFDADELHALFPQLTESEARAMLAIEQARGIKFIAFAPQCDNFDPLTGCKGHAK